MEFLNNKKFDVEIPKYFLNQLSMFETRLSKAGAGPKSNTWQDHNPDGNDPDELLIRNTYLNGLVQKNEGKKADLGKPYSFYSRKLQWADNNNAYRKDLLCTTNFNKDLVTQKEIKPMMNHKKMKPSKSILKKDKSGSEELVRTSTPNIQGSKVDLMSQNNLSSTTAPPLTAKTMTFSSIGTNQPIKNSTDLLNNYSNLGLYNSTDITNSKTELHSSGINNSNNNNFLMNKNSSPYDMKRSQGLEINLKEKENINIATRQNHFSSTNTPQQRSYSVGGGDRTQTNQTTGTNPTNIIIASKYQNIINNNVNNIYIQSPEDLEKLANRYNPSNFDSNNNKQLIQDRPVSQITRDSMGMPVNNSYIGNNNSMLRCK
jgi:hypothetical protein